MRYPRAGRRIIVTHEIRDRSLALVIHLIWCARLKLVRVDDACEMTGILDYIGRTRVNKIRVVDIFKFAGNICSAKC